MVGPHEPGAMSIECRVGPLAAINGWLAAELEAAFAASPADHRPLSIALSGGSVATDCFPALAAVRLDWSRVRFVWADERAVAPDHPDSNYRIADERWFQPAGVPAASVLRMPAEQQDLAAAAAEYEAALTRTLGPQPTLDLSLLGMGPDGHLASLFPGHPLLEERDRLVAPITDSPKPPPRRLTLTLPMLARTRRTVLVVLGAAKAEALQAVVDDRTSSLPAARLIRATARPLVLADEDAGRLVSYSRNA